MQIRTWKEEGIPTTAHLTEPLQESPVWSSMRGGGFSCVVLDCAYDPVVSRNTPWDELDSLPALRLPRN